VLIRFCTFCGEKIADQSRIMHRSAHCTDACWRDDRKELLLLARQRRCPTCHRSGRPENQPAAETPCIFHTEQGNLPLESTNATNSGEKDEVK
jgi:hypothetical protein